MPLTIREATDQLGVDRRVVNKLLRSGRLKGSKAPGPKGAWSIEQRDLDAYLEATAGQFVGHAEAAEIMGCKIHLVSDAIAKGVITPVPGQRPGLPIEQVRNANTRLEELRAERQEAKARKAVEQAAHRAGKPDPDHDWLSLTQAAERLGISRTAVARKVALDKIPHSRGPRGRAWIRADLLETFALSYAWNRVR